MYDLNAHTLCTFINGVRMTTAYSFGYGLLFAIEETFLLHLFSLDTVVHWDDFSMNLPKEKMFLQIVCFGFIR